MPIADGPFSPLATGVGPSVCSQSRCGECRSSAAERLNGVQAKYASTREELAAISAEALQQASMSLPSARLSRLVCPLSLYHSI